MQGRSEVGAAARSVEPVLESVIQAGALCGRPGEDWVEIACQMYSTNSCYELLVQRSSTLA